MTLEQQILDQGAKDNASKIRFYTENKTEHKQVVIEGRRPSGAKWKLICDKALKDVLTDLNNAGISTLFSCEGRCYRSIYGQLKGSPGYITIRYPKTRTLYTTACKIVKSHFKEHILLRFIDNYGRVEFQMYRKDIGKITAHDISRIIVGDIAISSNYEVDD